MPRPDDLPTTPAGAVDLHALGEQLLARARERPDAGRAARTLTPGEAAPLSQTMLALLAGQRLADHRAPGAATLVVLRGRATLDWDDGAVHLAPGEWVAIPEAIHSLQAHEDATLLLTVARGPGDVHARRPGAVRRRPWR